MRRLLPLLLLCGALAVSAGCARTVYNSGRAATVSDWVDPAGGTGASTSPGTAGSASPSPAAASPTPSGTPPTPQAANPVRKASPSTTPTPTSSTSAGSGLAQQVLAQINQLRAANGLPAYKLATGLIASAHQHNLVMSGGCGLAHQCPKEAVLSARISAQGVSWRTCGENIGEAGRYANTEAATLGAAKMLTTSMYNEKAPNDGHRRNLLSSSFTQIGIDVVRDSNGTVWLTQDFTG